jgi:EAL and modified HD-GYP domain-containing signal transduction protein
MSSWLSRWLGRSESSAPARRVAAAAVPPAQPASAATETALPLLPRQPLIDREGRLAGFEFPVPDLLVRRLAQGADDSVLGAHASALFAAMGAAAEAGRVALVVLPGTLPADWLARPALLAQLRGRWLVLEPAAFNDPASASLQALRAAGAMLGVSQVPRRGASFVRIDAAGLDRQAMPATIAACRAAASGTRILAAGLGDVDDVEAALVAGADLAAGHFDRVRTAPSAAPLPPAMTRVSRLLNHVLQDAELGAIAAELRADVSLSYEVLRHANSPLLGAQRQIDAPEQAVMLLGRDALYRWLCARLLAALPGRKSARALQEIALARALLFEQLAPACDAAPSTLYTMGLLSLLDVMVPMPMAEALKPLNLPQEMRAALVDHGGPWGGLMALAACLERGDLAGASAHAPAFGGMQPVLAANEAAWHSARQMATSLWAKS